MEVEELCRVCCKNKESLIEIFMPSDVCTLLQKHLWFEIEQDDRLRKICEPCWTTVKNFDQFYTETYNSYTAYYLKFDENKTKEEKEKVDDDAHEVPSTNSESHYECNEISDDDDNGSKEQTIKQPVKKKMQEKIQIAQEDENIRKFFSLSCELCPTQFLVFVDLKIHYRKEHKIKGYIKCCGKKLNRRGTVLDHMQRHENPDIFKCNICDKCMATKQTLYIHNVTKHASTYEKSFKCPHCPKKFARNFVMRQHLLSHASLTDKKYGCDKCELSFITNSLLQTHKRATHEGALTTVCEICAKSFRCKQNYDRHMAIEHCASPQPKVQCHLCGVWLKHDLSLRRHMKAHEDSTKSHICNICGKQSPSRSSLLCHKRYTHVLKRTHKCFYCEKAFKMSKELREHTATHTGEVLYTCPYCPKTFNSSANRSSHKRKVHPNS